MMSKTVGIKFINEDRLYYVKSDIEDELSNDTFVVVSTESGLKYAKCYSIIDEDVTRNCVIGDVIRVATLEDEKNNEKNILVKVIKE